MLGIGVYAGIVIALAAKSLARPSVALSMIFFVFALDQWGSALASGYLPSETFTNYLAAGMIAFSIFLLYLLGTPHRFLGGPAFWLVFALFAYSLISVLWAAAPDQMMAVWSVNFQYLIVFLLGAPLLVQHPDDVEEPVRAFLLLGVPFVFCLNFLLEWGYRGFIVNGEVMRLPLALAQFGGHLMIVGALYRPGPQFFWTILRIAAFILGALLIIKTGARGQFISAILCTAALFAIGRSNLSFSKLLISSLIAGILVAIAYVAAISYMQSDPVLEATANRWSLDRLTEDYGGQSERVLRIEAMMEAWSESPGTMLIGLGNSASYDADITGCALPIACYPHNLLVEILTEEGIVGAVIFAMLIIYILVMAIRTVNDPAIDSDQKQMLKILLAFAAFEMILSLKQGSLLGNWRFFLFVLLLDRLLDLVRNPVAAIGRQDHITLNQTKTRAWLDRCRTRRRSASFPSHSSTLQE